jgi:hypothetical protein
MDQIKMLELSDDAALLTYSLIQTGSYKGQNLPAKISRVMSQRVMSAPFQ